MEARLAGLEQVAGTEVGTDQSTKKESQIPDSFVGHCEHDGC